MLPTDCFSFRFVSFTFVIEMWINYRKLFRKYTRNIQENQRKKKQCDVNCFSYSVWHKNGKSKCFWNNFFLAQNRNQFWFKENEMFLIKNSFLKHIFRMILMHQKRMNKFWLTDTRTLKHNKTHCDTTERFPLIPTMQWLKLPM